MGRGTRQAESYDQQFAYLLGTRRGSKGGHEDKDEQDLEYLKRLIEPTTRKPAHITPLTDLYDLESIYRAGIIPSSPLYSQLIQNLEKSIIGVGSNFQAPYMVPGPRMHIISQFIIDSSEEFKAGPGQPVIQALSYLLRAGQVAPSDLQSMLGRMKGEHSPCYKPLFEACISRNEKHQEEKLLNHERMSVIILDIKHASVAALKEELRPFIVLVGKRLEENKSSFVEYQQAAKLVAEADKEHLAEITEISEGVASYKARLDKEAKERKLSYQISKRFQASFRH
jgi:hypothetical protein